LPDETLGLGTSFCAKLFDSTLVVPHGVVTPPTNPPWDGERGHRSTPLQLVG
jgi:hypothetical protein